MPTAIPHVWQVTLPLHDSSYAARNGVHSGLRLKRDGLVSSGSPKRPLGLPGGPLSGERLAKGPLHKLSQACVGFLGAQGQPGRGRRLA